MIGSFPSGWEIEIVWLPSAFVTTLTADVNPSFPALPTSPLSPLSPFAPLIFPASFHSPSFLTSTSPVFVLMNVSPSFPSWAVGVLVPFRISFPSRPFCPFVPFWPSRPWRPCSPLSPFGPVAPVSPFSPLAPTTPFWPSLMIDVPRTISVPSSNWLFSFLSL